MDTSMCAQGLITPYPLCSGVWTKAADRGLFNVCSANTLTYCNYCAFSSLLLCSFTFLLCALLLLIPLLCTDSSTALKLRAIPPHHRSSSSAPDCHLQLRPPHTQVAHLHTMAHRVVLRLWNRILCFLLRICVHVWLFAGIREQTEIKQSVSKLTEEVSADLMMPHLHLSASTLG